jgi:hypothetical protein
MSAIVDFEPGFLKTVSDFPYFADFEKNVSVFQDAYRYIVANDLMQQMPGLVEKKTVQKDSWFLFPIYINCNYDFYLDFLSYKVGVDVRMVLQHLRDQLPEMFQILDRVIEIAPVISVTFMRMKPGTTLKVHADSGSFQYRSHMGLIVPNGNCGLRVKDTVAKWKEGKFLIFDAAEPHLAWNLTNEDRIVLSVDLFKEPLAESKAMHLEEIRRKMENSPLGFDGGGYVSLDEATVRQFNRIV